MKDQVLEKIEIAFADARRVLVEQRNKVAGNVAVMLVRVSAGLRQARKEHPSDTSQFMDGIDLARDACTEVERWLLDRSSTPVYDSCLDNAQVDLVKAIDGYFDDVIAAVVHMTNRAEDAASVSAQRAEQLADSEFRLKEAERKINDLTKRTGTNPAVRSRVHAMTDGKCFYCGHELVLSRSDLANDDARRLMHLDHVVPRSCGGPDHETNFVPACEPCNIAKGDRHMLEYIRDRHPQLKLVASR